MPQVDVDGLTINYAVEGQGEPLLLIPYTGADHACYAFQLPAYTEHFRCIAVDLPGSGESSKAPGPILDRGLRRPGGRVHGGGRHRAGARGRRLARRGHRDAPGRPPPRAGAHALAAQLVAAHRRLPAGAGRDVALARPRPADGGRRRDPGRLPVLLHRRDVRRAAGLRAGGLEDFVRSRPAQPLDAFIAQTDAVLAHDATEALPRIAAPTQITFGAHDICTSTRFAEPLQTGIGGSEVAVFDHLSHAGLHENADVFNALTLDFLRRPR